MTRLSEIQGHITSMDELLEIVGAMRSLAGMRVQEAQRALPAIRNYAESMAAAIGSALLLAPHRAAAVSGARARRALVLFAAEHGFVGGFNERLLDAAEAALKSADALFVLGSRGAAQWLERGHADPWSIPMATRPAAAPDTVGRLVADIYADVVRGEIARVDVMFCRYHRSGAADIQCAKLLPIDTEAFALPEPKQPPLHNLDPQVLLEALIGEYTFARLTEATIESMASENAARLAAMESAHENVSKRLVELNRSAREARQNEITDELLDLITGAEALAEDSPKDGSRP